MALSRYAALVMDGHFQPQVCRAKHVSFLRTGNPPLTVDYFVFTTCKGSDLNRSAKYLQCIETSCASKKLVLRCTLVSELSACELCLYASCHDDK